VKIISLESFEIKISPKVLDDLSYRLANTRWPDEVKDSKWNYGANLSYMKELIDYWQKEYDWRRKEAELNQFSHYLTKIDGHNIHFIHEHGKGPNPTPIIITHGWPGSFYEICKLIPLLTDPESYGGEPDESFDIIIPSLPGFGFSDHNIKNDVNTLSWTAQLWAKLMTKELGYKQFASAGGDFGSIVTQYLADLHPELLIGIHLTYIGYYTDVLGESDLSKNEKSYLNNLQEWITREGAYFMIHSTKPQTLSYGLNDSPVGLAAWITEKFQSWTDKSSIIGRISKDELLTNIMIYWVSETINSSIRTYASTAPEKMKPLPSIPTAFASFPETTFINAFPFCPSFLKKILNTK
jgi:pimeloyl-ACP methyl ester carboxylesterase